MRSTRRGFFVQLVAVAAALVQTPRVIQWAKNTTPTIGSIDRATFQFWRNQPITFKGVPVVYDETCPNNRINALRPYYRLNWESCRAHDGRLAYRASERLL